VRHINNCARTTCRPDGISKNPEKRTTHKAMAKREDGVPDPSLLFGELVPLKDEK
jgi:hypothetical protein